MRASWRVALRWKNRIKTCVALLVPDPTCRVCHTLPWYLSDPNLPTYQVGKYCKYFVWHTTNAHFHCCLRTNDLSLGWLSQSGLVSIRCTRSTLSIHRR
ncbi:hypothetical protein F5B22DRAFT_599231 [Xylaria bambusicola]|uniref:uncharacterized protein n=1 Tax=Xylaria bambusicola TaxID=326684 RepID=UPI0020084659|nr:uncharacterized protein F5B22DRAFT_599231 [Xylaria bambusicola]KAI0518441.1 hypothetical protein F5B22DRAFT_599231 [Xylaria bambusicola]